MTKNDNNNEHEIIIDEEGLCSYYDIIIIGTNITQCLLASALTFAQYKVLHVDATDVYGGIVDSTFDLRGLNDVLLSSSSSSSSSRSNKNTHFLDDLELLTCHYCSSFSSSYNSANEIDPRKKKKQKKGNEISIQTNYGLGLVLEEEEEEAFVDFTSGVYSKHLTIKLLYGTLYQHILYNSSNSDSKYANANSNNPLVQHALYSDDMKARRFSHEFALDITPKVLLSNGVAVQGLVLSNVAQYIEFKGILGIDIALELEVALEDDGLDKRKIVQVPSSKSDVFQCSWIANKDKRKLMKLLAIIRDYGISANEDTNEDEESNGNNQDPEHDQEEIVMTLNERKLSSGRSLTRPQNQTMADISSVQQNLNTPFRTFLMQHQRLPKYLADMIQYALAMDLHGDSKLEDDNIDDDLLSTKDAMEYLYSYITSSLGRQNNIPTGYLQPMYGSGEFSSGFCRSAAVHGATYLLRRQIKKIVTTSSVQESEDGEKIKIEKVCGVVLGTDYSLQGTEEGDNDHNRKRNDKLVKCRYCIIPSSVSGSALISTGTNNYRQSAVTGKVVWRMIAILHYGYLMGEQRHVVIFPPDENNSIGNILTPIQAVILDYNCAVAPMGYTVVHLTTTIESTEQANKNEVHIKKMLHSALDKLRTERFENASIFWCCIFSRLAEGSSSGHSGVKNLYSTNDSSYQGLCLDVHFKNARKIYDQIVMSEGPASTSARNRGEDSGENMTSMLPPEFLFRDKSKYESNFDHSDNNDDEDSENELESAMESLKMLSPDQRAAE